MALTEAQQKDDDRAWAEFRGFEHIALAQIEQTSNIDVIEKLGAILTNIENALQKRKKVVISG
jgi:hypothetical protein